MTRAALPFAAVLLLAGCGTNEAPAPAPEETPAVAAPAEAAAATTAPSPSPTKVADLPALVSKDCSTVVEFYLEALGGREWAKAALVWNDRTVDAARLEAVFGSYKELQLAWNEPFVEGAAGSAYCTVSGKLTDAKDPAKPPVEGTLLLKRVNDVPGATADQLRWTLQSSTFVERLDRSDGSKP